MKKVALTTFGCKANQFDTAVLESLLRKEAVAIVDFGAKADFYVINSCAITASACREARQFARRAHKTNPEARIIVTGCSAQTDSAAFEKMGIVHHVVGNEEKGSVVEYICRGDPCDRPSGGLIQDSPLRIFYETPSAYPGHSRAFLKIQDGCSQFCSFCIVPFARGLNRSVPPDKILESMQKLRRREFNEIVLTGIHLGTYGYDLMPRTSLCELMRRIDREKPAPRVRISSVDPEELSDETIDLIAGSDIFCRHLHLPLQSGDDGILKKMRRRYTAGHFAGLAERLNKRMPDMCIGTDLIAGFPGEGDREFEASRRLLAETPVHYIHTFPYSDRKGTKAEGFQDKVEPKVIRRRAQQVRDLSSTKRRAFQRNFIGQTLEGVIESRGAAGQPVALTRNYISVEITDECYYSAGSLAPVRIDAVDSAGARGVVSSHESRVTTRVATRDF
ncbi:MAG: tRNA (N(6)-L-threonylcarbamoyladenosine(37)-C(2))-methylthiotransferase MtaB [Deltaproteobacteria bacterium]|nr:tRNA (N(6)-L-threonylcarbamoyladenosine(37)-C(2))-methylthiotransferase MtaB [Deltaproteobacteria bacterium]